MVECFSAMLPFTPTRRDLITAAPVALAASILPAPLWAQPGPSGLQFLVVGDWGRDGAMYQRRVARFMAKAARETRNRFIVTTGDNFYKRGVSDARDPQWDSSFEQIYSDPALQTHWFPVLGNHDWLGNVVAQFDRSSISPRWHLPYYRYTIRGRDFGHPEVDLFFIDTVSWQGETGFWRWLGSSTRPEEPQAERNWLEQQLSASCARVKLVFGHHPIYSVAKHGGAMQMPDLDRILRAHGVTAFITGHDHCLYHISRTDADGGTLHYICSGGGSEELHDYKGGPVSGCVLKRDCPDGHPLAADAPHWHSYFDRAGFAALDVGSDRLALRFIDRDGLDRYQATILAPAAARQPCVASA